MEVKHGVGNYPVLKGHGDRKVLQNTAMTRPNIWRAVGSYESGS